LKIPVAHFDGNYFVDPETLAELENNNQVIFRYSDPAGNITEEANINGSLHNIAGISNRKGNILGMMPHPERASESILGSDDGRIIFESMIQAFLSRRSER